MNQIAGLLFFLSIIFFSLEIKVKEETDLAMKPFRAAQEEAEKQKEVKEAGLPKPAKDTPEKASDKKKNNKGKAGGGKEGDFRVGLWGQLRSEIIENEKAQKLEARNDPYNLDYLTKIGNFEVIARYMFAQNRLSGGCYILLGSPIENLEEAKQAARLKVGEPCPSWVKLDFSYYKDLACQILNSAAAADNFFYEMYISMASQMGPPKATALEELENAISRKEKIESVLANERILTYSWETARSTVNFYFACLDTRPYFRLEYLSNKELLKGN
ncbi:MAG: hypothetical protein ACOYXC_07670 [Candidatus Rifleibacteriota bacterium]